jgi:hypothetical protein
MQKRPAVALTVRPLAVHRGAREERGAEMTSAVTAALVVTAAAAVGPTATARSTGAFVSTLTTRYAREFLKVFIIVTQIFLFFIFSIVQ